MSTPRRLPPTKRIPLSIGTPPAKRLPIEEPPSRRLPPAKAHNKPSPQELGSGCVPKHFDSRVHCIACSGSGISSVKSRCIPCQGTGRKKHGTY